MVGSGGPGNIHGIIFQILRTAQWAVRLRLTTTPGNLRTARLIAEPQSGGDLQTRFPDLQFSDRRVVQQFKTRSGDRTWSLQEVVEEVLPDLYRAVDLAALPQTRFEFVTDGRMGNWRAAMEFFASLGRREPPASPLHAVDNVQSLRFFGRGKCTRRQLFRRICDVIRSHPTAKKDPLLLTRRKVWHLLGRFRFVRTPGPDHAERSLLVMLRPFVEDDDAVEVASNAIIVELLRLSRKGDAEFTSDQLLATAGIDPGRFAGSAPLQEAVRQLVRHQTQELVGFRSELSVRPACVWRGTKRLLCFRGDAGVGKSWALASLAQAEDAVNPSVLSAFTRATGDIVADIDRVVKQIHEDLLGSGTVTSLDAAKTFAEEIMPGVNPWLTVCIDGVTFDDVQSLAELPLDRYGLRVAVTLPEKKATRSALERLNVEVVDIVDFTEDELAEFLRRHGKRVRDIRDDMLVQMQRPLRAELYVRVTSGEWRQTNEYMFYSEYWESMLAPVNRSRVAALARTALDEGSLEWSLDETASFGLSDPDVDRLEAVGWLRREGDKVSFWHERFLNWAVAESVVADNSSDIEALAMHIANAVRTAETPAPPHLGYVPMDACWLFAKRHGFASDPIAELLSAIEAQEAFRTDVLYRELIPTLGPSIAGALAARARRAAPDEAWQVELNVWRGLEAILTDPSADSVAVIQSLLESEESILQKIGVRLALTFPDGSFAEPMWQIYRRLKATLELPGEDRDSGIAMQNSELAFGRERAFTALVRATLRNLAWLRSLVNSEEENFADVLWLLSNIDTKEGRETWFDLKQTVFGKLPVGSERALLHCLRTACDETEVPRILEILDRSQDHFLTATAFSTLAVIAPDLAIQRLSNTDAVNLAFTRGWWLPWLMLRRRDATVAALRDLIKSDRNVVPYAAQFFSGHEEYLDPELARAFLDWLAAELPEYLERGSEKKHLRLDDVVKLLTNVADTEIFDLYGGVEATFVAHVQQLSERLSASKEGHLRFAAQHAGRFLLLLSRDAFEASLARHLENTPLTPTSANWAIPCDSERVRARLRSIATKPAADPKSRREVLCATRSLAAIGDATGVIEGILIGDRRVHSDVASLLAEQPPMGRDIIAKAEQALVANDPQALVSAVAAVGVSGVRELLPVIAGIAKDAPRDSRLRTVALYALGNLLDTGTPVEEMLGDFDDWAANHVIIAWLLRRSGSEAALAKLEDLIYSSPEFDSTSYYDVAVDSIDNSERGGRIAEFVWSRLRSMPLDWWHDAWIERIAPRIHNRELQKKIAQAARDLDIRAIHALTVFDPEAAFEEATEMLKSEYDGRGQASVLLVRLDEERGIPLLVARACEDRSAKVRAAIGRALRQAAPINRVVDELRPLFSAADSEHRAAACEVSGWLPDVEEWRIGQCAAEDSSRRVQERALAALGRRRSLRGAAGLLARLKVSRGFEAWRIAELLVRTGDAQMFASTRDPLSIWASLADKPLALRIAVGNWLEERKKEIEKAEDWQSRRDSDF
jgi:hypothetical protein